jgi:hypothetical protein
MTIRRFKKISFHYRRATGGSAEYYSDIYTTRDCGTETLAADLVKEFIKTEGLMWKFARIIDVSYMNRKLVL